MQQSLGQSGQDTKNLLYTTGEENGPSWSLWQEDSRPQGFGAKGTKDTSPAAPLLSKRSWQLVEGFELLQKGWAPRHSSSWHPDSWCWAGCSKGKSLPHIMPLMTHGES